MEPCTGRPLSTALSRQDNPVTIHKAIFKQDRIGLVRIGYGWIGQDLIRICSMNNYVYYVYFLTIFLLMYFIVTSWTMVFHIKLPNIVLYCYPCSAFLSALTKMEMEIKYGTWIYVFYRLYIRESDFHSQTNIF